MPSDTFTWISTCWTQLGWAKPTPCPVPGGLSVEQLTAGIAAIRARVPIGAAALASYAPEYDSKKEVYRAAFAALDAVLADGV